MITFNKKKLLLIRQKWFYCDTRETKIPKPIAAFFLGANDDIYHRTLGLFMSLIYLYHFV